MFPEDGVVKILVPSHMFYTIHTLYLDDLNVTYLHAKENNRSTD